jgi:hypothetical protein
LSACWRKTVVPERNADTWEFGKGALSANVYFFGNPSWAIGVAANLLLAEDSAIAGMVEKICLSGEERLFRKSRVISGAVVARVPRRSIKEFWLTILSEANVRMVKNYFR